MRSAHVKLRRELQDFGFLTPIDIEHAIFRSTDGSENKVIELLISDGYSQLEIERALSSAIDRKLILREEDILLVTAERSEFAKRLFIVDLIAIIGEPVEVNEGNAGNVLIPGYGKLFGSQLMIISQKLDEYAPNTSYSRNEFAECITWLTEEKLIILR